MSLRVGQVYPGMRGMGSVSYQLLSQVMNPQGAHNTHLHVQSQAHWNTGGVEVSITLEVDGVMKPLFTHIYTGDELADAYEIAHHQVHGYDARGLDPREGATRLKPR